MAVSVALLEQLLQLDEAERLEITHALLESVETDDVSAGDHVALHASIERSLDDVEHGRTVPFDVAMEALRSKRAARAAR